MIHIDFWFGVAAGLAVSLAAIIAHEWWFSRKIDESDSLYCLVCGDGAQPLGVDTGKMVQRIEIPSCRTMFGHTRIVTICMECSEDLRQYLTGNAP